MINIAVKLFEINGLQHTICSAKFILIVQMFAWISNLPAGPRCCCPRMQYKCCILQTKCWFILTEVDRVVIDGN